MDDFIRKTKLQQFLDGDMDWFSQDPNHWKGINPKEVAEEISEMLKD